MKKRHVLSVLCVMVIAATLFAQPVRALASDGTSYVFDGYTYDFFGNVKESPAAFQLQYTIDADDLDGIALSSIDDVCTSDDGRIFLIDSVESRMNVFLEDGTLVKSVKLVRDAENKIALDEAGNQIMLTSPEGVFVHEKQSEIYIADTGAKRVVVLDLETYALKWIIGQPEDMTGVTEFKPSKVTVDLADRIYVVVQSSYEGIIELTRNGSFSGYYGVNVPSVSIIDYFWKMIASDEQKAQMSKTYAPAFNNITLDGEGFIMAVTYDTASEAMVFRLNSKGENVLREEGFTPVLGELWSIGSTSQTSQFVDLAVTDYGTYALIDRSYGRIFLYNFDGEILNVFGTLGNLKGQFKQPSGIAWLGEKLVVTDKALKCAYIMSPTAFGQAVLRGNEHYYNGEWDEALVYFEEAIALNANYAPAYTGIGKNYLMKDDYDTAMYYFEMGQAPVFYSEAYNGHRGLTIENNFTIIMLIMVVLIGAVVYSEIRYHKYGGKKPAKKRRHGKEGVEDAG